MEVIHASRRPPWPLWAVMVVLAWLALGSLVIWLSGHLGRPVQLCLFKQLTHIPCPTCGFTRGALCLLHGEVGKAWLCNPFLFSVLGLFFGAAIVRVLFARCVRVHVTWTERVAAWILVIALMSANWAYVILYVR
jgi:hypothetical protein